jgi:hypothetical protein
MYMAYFSLWLLLQLRMLWYPQASWLGVHQSLSGLAGQESNPSLVAPKLVGQFILVQLIIMCVMLRKVSKW